MDVSVATNRSNRSTSRPLRAEVHVSNRVAPFRSIVVLLELEARLRIPLPPTSEWRRAPRAATKVTDEWNVRKFLV